MDRDKQKVIQLLAEAHSNELALINTLEAHVRIAEPGSYRQLLQSHIKETRGHANKIGRRLDQLGFRKSIVGMGVGLVQNVTKQSFVIAKGPIDMLRGGGDVKEKMLRNAMDEAMTEGLEIGSYDAIESFARSIGDHETAELVAEIRLDEERMFDALRKEIPVLADQVARDVVSVDLIAAEEPWEGYDEQTVEEITDRLDDASASLLLAVRNYERKNKNRKTVIDATDRETVSV